MKDRRNRQDKTMPTWTQNDENLATYVKLLVKGATYQEISPMVGVKNVGSSMSVARNIVKNKNANKEERENAKCFLEITRKAILKSPRGRVRHFRKTMEEALEAAQPENSQPVTGRRKDSPQLINGNTTSEEEKANNKSQYPHIFY